MQRKALALVSGGLDSLLAAKIMKDLGVQVEGICFVIGFNGGVGRAQQSMAKLGIKLNVVDVIDEFQQVLLNPKFGYGANLNPCLDCKIFMVQKALEWAKQHGFDFVVTGEVLGQRPMSQRKDTLPVVVKESGAMDLLLRPLSAKLLPPTLPEREGWVDRDKLFAISGRSRKQQIELAEQLGITDFPQPAGGCALTDANFCNRLRDLWECRGKHSYSRDDLRLLRVGRHLRINANFKLIVGRDEKDNAILNEFYASHIKLNLENVPGPTVLIDGDVSDNDIIVAARICAYFSKAKKNSEHVEVVVRMPSGEEHKLTVRPLQNDEFNTAWYI